MARRVVAGRNRVVRHGVRADEADVGLRLGVLAGLDIARHEPVDGRGAVDALGFCCRCRRCYILCGRVRGHVGVLTIAATTSTATALSASSSSLLWAAS